MATELASTFLDALSKRVLVFDGAMGTSLQSANPTTKDFGGSALEGWMDGLVLHAPGIYYFEAISPAYRETKTVNTIT